MSGHVRWATLRALRAERGLVDENRIAKLGKQMRAETRGYRLQEMREQFNGLTVAILAERIGTTADVVERIERGDVDDLAIATLRAYVEQVGGEMEVLVKTGDTRIVIA
jgi:hypothetical protein